MFLNNSKYEISKKIILQNINLLILLAFFTMLIFSNNAFASEGSGGGLPYESWFSKLRDSVTGPVAFTISLIGIVVAGCVLIFGGDLNGFFRSMVSLVLIMSLIIGGNNILSGFFGRGADLTDISIVGNFTTIFVDYLIV